MPQAARGHFVATVQIFGQTVAMKMALASWPWLSLQPAAQLLLCPCCAASARECSTFHMNYCLSSLSENR